MSFKYKPIGIIGVAGSGKDTVAALIQSRLFSKNLARYDLYAFADPVKTFVLGVFKLDDKYATDRALKEAQIKFSLSESKFRSNFEYYLNRVVDKLSRSNEFYDSVREEIANRPIHTKSAFDDIMYDKFIEVIAGEIHTPWWVKLSKRLGVDDGKIYFKTTPRRLFQLAGTDFFRNHVRESVWIEIAPYHNTILTDVRFQNEADAVSEHGGKLIEVINSNNTSGTVQSSHSSETTVKSIKSDIKLYNSGTCMLQLTEEVDRVIQELVDGK